MSYQKYMNEGVLDKTVRTFYKKAPLPPILGDEEFISKFSQPYIPKSFEIKQISIGIITQIVSNHFNLKCEDLYMTKKGRSSFNLPRRLAIYILAKYTDHSRDAIADAFGYPHIGGISYVIQSFGEQLRDNDRQAKELQKILKKINEKRA